MKTLIVLKSVHHQNTERVAAAMAEVLAADIRSPEEVDQAMLAAYDLVGVGSGIYYARFHSELRRWAKGVRAARPGQKAFIFTTSGLPFLNRLYHFPLRQRLTRAGFDVVDEFHCSGKDTFGPLWLLGGLHRQHPNAGDLIDAANFARSLLTQFTDTANAPRAQDA